jgi:hypothetical protein
MSQTAEQEALRDAIQAEVREMALKDDLEPASLTKYVLIVEEFTEEGRRVSYICRNVLGDGLYQWDALGLVEYFKERYIYEKVNDG